MYITLHDKCIEIIFYFTLIFLFCRCALRLALLHTFVHPSIRPSRPEILCAQHPLMDFVHTHTQWPTDMVMTVKKGFCDAASFTWVMGLCHGGASVSYRHIFSYSSITGTEKLHGCKIILFMSIEFSLIFLYL